MTAWQSLALRLTDIGETYGAEPTRVRGAARKINLGRSRVTGISLSTTGIGSVVRALPLGGG